MADDRDGVEGDAFTTLTHARLRAAQGDVEGARRIVEAILASAPDRREAVQFLRDLATATGQEVAAVAEETLPERSPESAANLAGPFRRFLEVARGRAEGRRERLARYLAAIQRSRGGRS